MSVRVKSEDTGLSSSVSSFTHSASPGWSDSFSVAQRQSAPPGDRLPHIYTMDREPLTPADSSHAESQGEESAMHSLHTQASKRIKIIQELEALNLQNAVSSLPKLVIIGDQSAGKSSIVEAICNVSLPRSDNTCTRVPFMIATSPSNSRWQCEVSLQLRYKYDQQANGGQFKHWIEQPQENIAYASRITDKDQLGAVLKGAQVCLLNPSPTKSAYQPSHTELPTKLQFSPNVICLRITGPELPELAFYDLPGIIRSTELREDHHLIAFVADLTQMYLQDEKALVMLACPANQDMQNCSAFTSMRDAGAEARCLGVLTKPDLLPEDGLSEQSKRRLRTLSKRLDGAAFQVGKGWYISRQPSQAELDEGIKHAEAKRQEQDFFSKGIWISELAKHRAQFGLDNLNAAVSKHLDEHIINELPHIARQIDVRLAGVEEELAHLPKQTDSPMHTISRVLGDLRLKVERALEESKVNKFHAEMRGHLSAFRKTLDSIAPQVDASSPEHQDRVKAERRKLTSETAERMGDAIMLDEDSDDAPSMRSTPQRSTLASLKRRAEQTTVSSKRHKSRGPDSGASKVTFTIARLRSIEVASTSNYKGGGSDGEADAELVKQSLAPWEAALHNHMNNIVLFVKGKLKAIIDSELDAYQKCPLYERTLKEASVFFGGLASAARKEADCLLEREMQAPGTLSDITRRIADVKRELTVIRDQARLREYYEMQEASGASTIKAAELQKRINGCAEPEKRAKDSVLKLDDPHLDTVQLLAYPIAYYELASARFVDSITIMLRHNFVSAISRGLPDALQKGLETSNLSKCEELLAEDPAVARRRGELLNERDRLLAGLAKLSELSQATL